MLSCVDSPHACGPPPGHVVFAERGGSDADGGLFTEGLAAAFWAGGGLVDRQAVLGVRLFCLLVPIFKFFGANGAYIGILGIRCSGEYGLADNTVFSSLVNSY